MGGDFALAARARRAGWAHPDAVAAHGAAKGQPAAAKGLYRPPPRERRGRGRGRGEWVVVVKRGGAKGARGKIVNEGEGGSGEGRQGRSVGTTRNMPWHWYGRTTHSPPRRLRTCGASVRNEGCTHSFQVYPRTSPRSPLSSTRRWRPRNRSRREGRRGRDPSNARPCCCTGPQPRTRTGTRLPRRNTRCV